MFLLPRIQFHKYLNEYSKHHPQFFFVQIGANDGVTMDPIHKHILKFDWQGILVEPVKFYFEQLVENYEGQNGLKFENIAITEKEGERDFFRLPIRRSKFLHMVGGAGLGSLSKYNLLKRWWRIPFVKKTIVREKVYCMTLNGLLEKHYVKKLDLLLIDAEGYDKKIVEQIDFNRLKPAIVVFEHDNMEKNERGQCENLLKFHGYEVRRDWQNVYAYLFTSPN